MGSKLVSSVSSGSYNIATSPLYFVRSGYVNPNNMYLNVAGSTGYYWSSSPYSNGTYAYDLVFNTGVNPSISTNRYYGHSLRCLAR